MSSLPSPDGRPDDTEPENADGHAFLYSLLSCAALPSLLGVLMAFGNGEQYGLLFWMLVSPVIPLGVFVTGFGAYVTGQQHFGSGLMLGSVVGALIGFGVCAGFLSAAT